MIETKLTFPWTDSYPEDASWGADIPIFTVGEMLDHTVQQFGQKPAFDFFGFKHNWEDIGRLVDDFAASLQSSGFQKGQKVGLLLPNTPYFLVAYYAVLKIGGVVVNFNPLYAEDELAYQIEDSETDIMVTCDLAMMVEKLTKMLHRTRLNQIILCRFTDILPFPKSLLFKLFKRKEIATVQVTQRILWFDDMIDVARDAGAVIQKVDIDPMDDIAVLQYTGGTTGVPKGAMLTHRNVVANAHQASMWLSAAGGKKAERMLGVLPFFHVFAMSAVMNLSVLNGMEIIALPRFDLQQTLDLIQKKKPHLMPAVPAIFNAINNHKNVHKYDLSALQNCISGGASLPVEVKKKFEEKTGAVVVEGYGLTEASPVLCCNPVVGKNKAGSIGLPLPGTFIEIVDPEDKETLIEQGGRGELCARGPQVMKGYWNKEHASDEVLRDMGDGTWRLYTGDIAIMDEDGYVFIVDRIKDLIITNGYNVYPRNIEDAIYAHPAVEECIVAGIPDQNRGEIVKAWIKLKDGRELTVEDLKVFLKDKISPMEIPKRVEFRDEELPKTLIGKLSRKDVLAQES